MIVAQISRAGGPFELVERPVPEPGLGQVLIKVEACGICHSDQVFKEGHWPDLKFPCVPGHEVAGRIEKIGAGITRFKAGQRAGVGWNGGYCTHCEPCREGEFPFCTTGATTGASFDGGYGEYMVAPETAVAAMPEGIEPSDWPSWMSVRNDVSTRRKAVVTREAISESKVASSVALPATRQPRRPSTPCDDSA